VSCRLGPIVTGGRCHAASAEFRPFREVVLTEDSRCYWSTPPAIGSEGACGGFRVRRFARCDPRNPGSSDAVENGLESGNRLWRWVRRGKDRGRGRSHGGAGRGAGRQDGPYLPETSAPAWRNGGGSRLRLGRPGAPYG